MREPVFVGCVLVAEGGTIYPGSVKRHCRGCGRAIWASPATIELVETEPIVVLVCLDCARERAETDPTTRFGILPGSLRELRAWIRRN